MATSIGLVGRLVHFAPIGAYDAKARLSELLDRVARGDQIVITRHGKAVARLVSRRVDTIGPRPMLPSRDWLRWVGRSASARSTSPTRRYARCATRVAADLTWRVLCSMVPSCWRSLYKEPTVILRRWPS